jgi:hypothetical protein
MRHRTTQLILPFEPALPGRQLILAPRLWPTMTPTTQQQLAKRVAQLLRSMLAAADAGDLIGGHHDEHAAQFGKPGDDHRAKLAYIYVRQSTAGQVRQHQESTELQYRLADRAALFGWPKERIEIIDDDLGKVRYVERQPRRFPAADRRDWPREGGAGAESGCLAAGA